MEHEQRETETPMLDGDECELEEDFEFDELQLGEILCHNTTIDLMTDFPSDTVSVAASSSSSSALALKPKRKFVLSAEARERRNRRRRLNIIPRILKSDVRRDYATMLTNVLNMFDPVLMGQFMQRYCTEDCHLVDFMPEVVAFGVTPVIQLQGFSPIIKFWVNNHRYVPDFICQTSDTQLRIRLDNGCSKIVSKTRFRGTKVFQPALSDYDKRMKKFFLNGQHDNNNQILVDEHGLRVADPAHAELLSTDANQWLAHRVGSLPTPADPPIDLCFDGIFTLYVDPQNRIYKFEFLSSKVSPLSHGEYVSVS